MRPGKVIWVSEAELARERLAWQQMELAGVPFSNNWLESNIITGEASRRMRLRREEQIAYQQAMRRARPIIAQWSEWEQQTRNPAWR